MALASACSSAALCAIPQTHGRPKAPCSFAPSSRPPAPDRRRRSPAAAAAGGSSAGGFGGGSSSTAAQEAAVTKDYIKWAGEAGIISPKMQQAYFGELRGAKALDAIAPDEIFVTVPRAAAVVVAPNERCPCPDFVDAAFYKEAPWFVKMAVLLLWERSRGRASPVWGYIEQLPSSIDTPVRWSEAELVELQYAPAINEIRQQQAAWRQQYDKFSAAVKQGKHSYEDFLWALENVRSRAFSGPYTGSSVVEKARTLGLLLAAGGAYAAWQQLPLEQALNGLISVLVFNIMYDLLLSKKLKWYALCPVVDAINHSSLVESNVEYEYFRDQFVLSTKSAYKPGEQVFISYGAQSNGSLLQYYAFTEPNNPNDVYAFEAAIGGQKMQLTVNAKGSFTAECQAAARAALGGSSVQDDQLRTALLQAAEAELASKPTSAADDERLLQTPHLMAPRQRAAVEFRLEKKRVLERAIGRSRKRLGKQ
ncbi:SET domain-containing [Chlorella sorokiniana]|uniref:SET domain-containing n=1 Tax=Chlorella sorokiniana TaxID=3076 RepID=A0A2P6TUI6_CHLSO|nr:SET domain-containing [Chlorella sorokiniana]|eukprot:PRW57714.1 SET domain-containing [Chlorella sorokiniana]